MKRIISFFLAVFMLPTVHSIAHTDINYEVEKTAKYLCENVKNPTVSSIGGEWTVIGLAASGTEIPEGYFQRYRNNAAEYVERCGGVLHERKYTEYSRVALALNLIGESPENFDGYNLIEPLEDYEKTVWQGINGPIWAIIAINSGDYMTDLLDEKCEMYKEKIISSQNDDGGWGLTENQNSDVDITAMALCALAKCEKDDVTKNSIDLGVGFLSESQTETGGFLSGTAESTAQVISALCELGIDIEDGFVKDGKTLLDNLMYYSNDDGGFAHTLGAPSNQMATEQAFCALVELKRAQNGNVPLLLSGKGKSVNYDDKQEENVSTEVIFSDIDDISSKEKITALAGKGIINGMGDGLFAPNQSMTRAEFAAITTRAVGISENNEKYFADVSENDWFFGYVGAAYKNAIVNGVSESLFMPDEKITKQQAMLMVMRAAKYAGMDETYSDTAIRNILAVFPDYTLVDSWANEAAAFCYDKNILSYSEDNIDPNKIVTRAEIAEMLYNMLHILALI